MSIYFFLIFCLTKSPAVSYYFLSAHSFLGQALLIATTKMDTIFVFFSKSNYTKFIIHFLFYDYRTKKANDNRWPVGASLTNPLLMPRHLPMQTSPPGGGGGIESRRACDVVFELGAKPQIPKGSLILF